MSCEICKSKDTYIKEYQHHYTIRGEHIEFIKPRRLCKNCNHLVYDKELDNEASKEAIRLYNEKVGVTPESIIRLRKDFHLTQQQFSKIIGCAKKTLISYELGKSIPNDIYLVTLKTLIQNPDIIKNMMEATKERYEEEEYNQIFAKINAYLDNNSKQILFNESADLTIFNGFTPLVFEKIVGMVSILAKETVLKTKLLKEMFYADFLAYKNIGSSITGLEYSKWQFGPVPDHFDMLFQKLGMENIIEYTITYIDNFDYHEITCIAENTSYLSDEEKEIIEKVKKYFKSFTSRTIVEHSHQEKAFKETNFYEKISYDYAFDLRDL